LWVYPVEDGGRALLRDRGPDREFTRFVKEVEPRLSYTFYAAYGAEVGNEVTADALAYAWEHWDKITKMDNPAGYLYRVGQSKARRYRRPQVLFPKVTPEHAPECEPGLPAALEQLTESQRQAVILVYALEWTEEEAARVLGKSRSTLRTHLERGLAHLRQSLEVAANG
jgi:DNA-directed RNA polymerase specialized sigma24 family protein